MIISQLRCWSAASFSDKPGTVCYSIAQVHACLTVASDNNQGWRSSVGTKIWWIHEDLWCFSNQHGTTPLAESTSDVQTGSIIGSSSNCHLQQL